MDESNITREFMSKRIGVILRASDKVGIGPERWRPRRLKPSGVPPERAGFGRSHALSRRGRQRSADFVTGPGAILSRGSPQGAITNR
jgi:hypothetical protein